MANFDEKLRHEYLEYVTTWVNSVIELTDRIGCKYCNKILKSFILTYENIDVFDKYADIINEIQDNVSISKYSDYDTKKNKKKIEKQLRIEDRAYFLMKREKKLKRILN